jgi:hypothetical protein
MAINKNHEFEELAGVKCAIVERNASQLRVDFLKDLLEFNGYTVIVAAPPVKPTPAIAAAPVPEGAVPPMAVIPEPEVPAPPVVFTVGVTDVMFNPVNAVFGRLLKTKEGDIVTLAYWEQKEEVSNDEIPYFENPHSFKPAATNAG